MTAKEVAAKVWIEHPCFATVESAELFYELISPVINAALAELEQQVRVLENPRVTDEDWHKLALMYRDCCANDHSAAKIEGLRRALKIAEGVEGDIDYLTHLIDAEIAALENMNK